MIFGINEIQQALAFFVGAMLGPFRRLFFGEKVGKNNQGKGAYLNYGIQTRVYGVAICSDRSRHAVTKS